MLCSIGSYILGILSKRQIKGVISSSSPVVSRDH